MTLSLFLFMLTFGAAITGLLTETIKKFNENQNCETNPNITALICAFVVIIISVNAIVDEYNRFATHPSPHFLKKGGGLDSARD